jgi:uncharacterized protein YndB with AHSA1/START domain
MMTNPSRAGVTSFSVPNDQDVVITRLVDAPRDLVFEVWTDPKHVRKWLLGPEGWAMPVCEIDLRVGGKWHFMWRKDDGTEMAMTGTYTEVKAPERVVHTERWGPEWPETVNTLVLTESSGKTTIALTIHYPSKEARDAALKTGMKEGMEVSFARLDSVLAELG